MPYQFTSYSTSSVKLQKRSLLNAVEYSKENQKATREQALLHQAISFASNNSTKLYSLKDRTKTLQGILGYVALSASEIMIDKSKKPVVLIDLLFVNSKYRSKTYTHFENTKISQLLLEYAITKFYDVREHIGVNYLILYPENGRTNEKLVSFYKSMGFEYATKKHEWMYIKL
jgi:GNAT superfamily N-acetyltransferase